MIGALDSWVQAGWIQEEISSSGEKDKPVLKWRTRPRPVLFTLGAMLATHVGGGLIWWASTFRGRIPVSLVIEATDDD